MNVMEKIIDSINVNFTVLKRSIILFFKNLYLIPVYMLFFIMLLIVSIVFKSNSQIISLFFSIARFIIMSGLLSYILFQTYWITTYGKSKPLNFNDGFKTFFRTSWMILLVLSISSTLLSLLLSVFNFTIFEQILSYYILISIFHPITEVSINTPGHVMDMIKDTLFIIKNNLNIYIPLIVIPFAILIFGFDYIISNVFILIIYIFDLSIVNEYLIFGVYSLIISILILFAFIYKSLIYKIVINTNLRQRTNMRKQKGK